MKRSTKTLGGLLAIVMLLAMAPAAFAAEDALTGDIMYWSSWNPTESQALVMQDAAAAFMAENPGVSIEFNFVGRDISNQLLVALESGTKIDMFDANSDNVVKLWKEHCMDLSDYYTQAYPTTNSEPYEAVVMNAFTELAKNVGDGQPFYVSYIPQSVMFFYNKDIFADVGVEPPTTWAEFLAVCEAIQAAGYIPITTDDSRVPHILGYHLNRLKGSQWVLDLVNDSTMALWDDPAVLRAAEDWQAIWDLGYMDPDMLTNQNPATMQKMVIEGKIAMFLNGTWMPNETYEVAPDFNWGAFGYPVLEGGTDDLTYCAYGCYGIAINKDCPAPDAAFAFAVYLTTGEWDQAFAERANSIPMGLDATWPDALDDVRTVLAGVTHRYLSHTEIRSNSDLLPIISSAWRELLGGVSSPEQFINTVKGK